MAAEPQDQLIDRFACAAVATAIEDAVVAAEQIYASCDGEVPMEREQVAELLEIAERSLKRASAVFKKCEWAT